MLLLLINLNIKIWNQELWKFLTLVKQICSCISVSIFFCDNRKLLQQFVEDEAELSGSEAESDENLDLDEADDILEVEAGDAEELNNDNLRDEVGRVHMWGVFLCFVTEMILFFCFFFQIAHVCISSGPNLEQD